MLGNGMHFTLIGLRGGIEGFSAAELAVVTSGYFMGFLSGARMSVTNIRGRNEFTSANVMRMPGENIDISAAGTDQGL